MTEKYVVPKLMGGLGNQLHMISAAMDVALRTNRTLIFNYISHNPHSPEPRSLCDLFPEVPIRSDIQVVNDYPGETFTYKDIVAHINHEDTCISISGYNQHPKYIPEGFCKFIDNIPQQHPYVNMTDTAFVHFRRKDYVGHPYYEINMDVYYTTAVKTLLSTNPNVKLLVISDDTEWSYQYITNLLSGIMNRENILVLGPEYTATESLKIMANCLGGAICANSSFSWWGAYINRNRPIFMPTPWITLDENPNLGLFFEGVTMVFWKNGNIESHLPLVNINNMVSIQIGGCGLGNKIFKILAGMQYAIKTNKEFIISSSLNIQNNSLKPHENIDDNIISLIFPNVRFINSFSNYSILNDGDNYEYYELPYSNGNVLLSGYFQNEKYLPSSNLPVLRNSYYDNTYFIHIRAGDYLDNTVFLSSIIFNYYKQCFFILGKNIKYIVFSNDNNYTENYMKQFDIEYTISNKSEAYDVLKEMANCAGGICANSSFSWLGGLFQGDKRGNIFMPYKWVGNSESYGMYPSWARIIDMNSNIDSLFDVVIPVGPNDIDIIKEQIKYTKRNIIGYRNIYLIYINDSLQIEGCITICENIFPFSMETVQQYHGKLSRNGWYLQQLLKLYAGIVIPNILNKYLVIDTDTFFLKPTKFIEDGKCLYAYGTENTQNYFTHMSKLNNSFIKMDMFKSGICHHMIFETKYINEIINLIEITHNDIFYNVFLSSVQAKDYIGSGASEYEIYFNYILKEHPCKIMLRKLLWQNVEALTNTHINDYESVHWYIRK